MSSVVGCLEVEGWVCLFGVGFWLLLWLGGGVEVDVVSGVLVYWFD